MERVAIEVRSRTVTDVVILERVTQAADGRPVASQHPAGVRLGATEGSTFSLEAALEAGLVEMVDGEIVGAVIEPLPLPPEGPAI